jgi:hypothetical protein
LADAIICPGLWTINGITNKRLPKKLHLQQIQRSSPPPLRMGKKREASSLFILLSFPSFSPFLVCAFPHSGTETRLINTHSLSLFLSRSSIFLQSLDFAREREGAANASIYMVCWSKVFTWRTAPLSFSLGMGESLLPTRAAASNKNGGCARQMCMMRIMWTLTGTGLTGCNCYVNCIRGDYCTFPTKRPFFPELALSAKSQILYTNSRQLWKADENWFRDDASPSSLTARFLSLSLSRFLSLCVLLRVPNTLSCFLLLLVRLLLASLPSFQFLPPCQSASSSQPTPSIWQRRRQRHSPHGFERKESSSLSLLQPNQALVKFVGCRRQQSSFRAAAA